MAAAKSVVMFVMTENVSATFPASVRSRSNLTSVSAETGSEAENCGHRLTDRTLICLAAVFQVVKMAKVT